MMNIRNLARRQLAVLAENAARVIADGKVTSLKPDAADEMSRQLAALGSGLLAAAELQDDLTRQTRDAGAAAQQWQWNCQDRVQALLYALKANRATAEEYAMLGFPIPAILRRSGE